MRRKSVIAVLCILLLAILIPVVISTSRSLSRQQGAAYAGRHITVTKSDLDAARLRSESLLGSSSPEEELVEQLALREIFCYRAEEAKLPNDDGEFQTWLEEYRSLIENASNGEMLPQYTEKLGMTPEEYWEWLKTDEGIRREYYAGLFLEQLREEYDHSGNLTQTWEQYRKDYQEKALRDEQLKKID